MESRYTHPAFIQHQRLKFKLNPTDNKDASARGYLEQDEKLNSHQLAVPNEACFSGG